jgi:hypothetical protein
VWTGDDEVDVPSREVHEDIKKLRAEYSQTRASMAEGYVKDECIGFITGYLQRLTLSSGESGMQRKNMVMRRRSLKEVGKRT